MWTVRTLRVYGTSYPISVGKPYLIAGNRFKYLESYKDIFGGELLEQYSEKLEFRQFASSLLEN